MDGRQILIVDDDRDTCAMLTVALEAESYNPRLAYTVSEAVASLEQGPLPDLILLDLLLPGPSGEKLLAYLASNPAWSGVPVAIMSAWDKAGKVARRLGLELLPKPFSLADAFQLVRRLSKAPRS